jgi:dipeptidase E
MKFLLTSSGVRNASIKAALVDLLGKPIEESSALCIPTGINPFPGGFAHAYRFVSGINTGPMTALGWKSIGLMELAVLATIDEEVWVEQVKQADALLVQGGDVMYLTRMMHESGLAKLLPTLDSVYVGVSAGSMVTAPTFAESYDDPPWVVASGLGLVDVALLPHVGHADHPESPMSKVEAMAAVLPVPVYGIDDQTAIKVVDGKVDVVSEGHWQRFTADEAN